jgi:hypothetical protein
MNIKKYIESDFLLRTRNRPGGFYLTKLRKEKVNESPSEFTFLDES